MIKFHTFIFTILMLFFITFNSNASNRNTPITEAVALTKNSVVNIRTEKIVNQSYSPYNDPMVNNLFGFAGSYKTQSLGSGVIISEDGIIVTNNHVIESASKIFVILGNNQHLEASVIGSDPILDIAVIKINKRVRGLKPAKLGNSSDIMLGETVIAIGNPYGLNSSVTTGVVSNARRVLMDDIGYAIFIQVDASINPGNSGGPLINLDGEVIGINTAIYRAGQGIGFSLPIDVVKTILPEFQRQSKMSKRYTDFTVKEKVSAKDIPYLEVVAIDRNSGSGYEGIDVKDQIVMMDNVPINSKNAYEYILKTVQIGDSIEMIFAKGEDDNMRFTKANVTIRSYPENYGLTNFKNKYGITFTSDGKSVTVLNSMDNKYIMTNDIIVGVNDEEIQSLEQLNGLLNESIGEIIILHIARANKLFSLRIQT